MRSQRRSTFGLSFTAWQPGRRITHGVVPANDEFPELSLSGMDSIPLYEEWLGNTPLFFLRSKRQQGSSRDGRDFRPDLRLS